MDKVMSHLLLIFINHMTMDKHENSCYRSSDHADVVLCGPKGFSYYDMCASLPDRNSTLIVDVSHYIGDIRSLFHLVKDQSNNNAVLASLLVLGIRGVTSGYGRHMITDHSSLGFPVILPQVDQFLTELAVVSRDATVLFDDIGVLSSLRHVSPDDSRWLSAIVKFRGDCTNSPSLRPLYSYTGSVATNMLNDVLTK